MSDSTIEKIYNSYFQSKLNIDIINRKQYFQEDNIKYYSSMELKDRREFILQIHHSKKSGKHYDLRIEGKVGNTTISWALPGKDNTFDRLKNHQRVLAMKTKSHNKSFLNQKKAEELYARTTNEKIEFIDKGYCYILKNTKNGYSIFFDGNKLSGKYVLYNYDDPKYVLFKTKDKKVDG
jgi:hypothetical protein